MKMSCQAWEPQSSPDKSWATRQRLTTDWQKPCSRPSYYHTDAAPLGWSYYLPHADPTKQNDSYYRFPFFGSNFIYRTYGNFYSEPKGACVTNLGCIDGMNSSGCLYKPFYAGAKCAEVAEMGQPTTGDRSFAMAPGTQPSDFKPWTQMEQTWDTLLQNWAYNRPGYND